MTAHSAIYRGRVRHRRTGPKRHDFGYSLYMLYLDLDEVDKAFDGRWLWSHERFNLMSYRRRDFLGAEGGKPLRDAVLDEVEAQIGIRPSGAVRMLTQIRCFGYVFNPVTFYYCFEPHGEGGADSSGEPGGEHVAAIVAEITNTPWKERFRYVLRAGDGPVTRADLRKEFHISPFFGMNQDYRWNMTTPDKRLVVHMENFEDGSKRFDATLSMERQDWTGGNLARALARHPLMATKVSLGIYFQALRLWWKRTPFYSHPRQASS